ncbi:hypothetical protein QQ045_025767 [Rhodiola kirilowii]
MSRSLCALFLLAVMACSVSPANGYQFKVGERCGWSVNTNESYSHWAERNRFQVNDTLYFKYDKSIDSVLIVNKDDYDNCNAAKPILKLEGGESVFKFDRSGIFFFITSNLTNCQKVQKLIVVVLAVRSPPPPHVQPPATPPSPSTPAAPSPSAANEPSGSNQATAPSSSEGSPTKKSAATVVLSAICAVIGLSVIIV